jgi:hypothetical protein
MDSFTFFWCGGMSDHDSLLILLMYRSTSLPSPSTQSSPGLPATLAHTRGVRACDGCNGVCRIFNAIMISWLGL